MARSLSKSLSALRQLALVARSGQVSARAAIDLLTQDVGVDGASLLWLDEQSEMVDATFCTPVLPSVVLDYQEYFVSRPHLEMASGISVKLAQQSGARVCTTRGRRNERDFIRSEFYNRIARPSGYGHYAALPIRNPDGVPLACLHLGRELRRSDFSDAEIRLLEQAHSWIEHLLQLKDVPEADTAWGASDESASLILNGTGKILSASPGALWLVHQAADSSFSGALWKRSAQGDVANLLACLVKPAVAALHDFRALPPTLSVRNRWGKFHLRSYVMSAMEPGEPLQISLYVERHVPVSLKLFKNPQFLALTEREREVVLHILAGYSHTEIAERLGIKPSTAIYHTRQIYRKLDITRQTELLQKLVQ